MTDSPEPESKNPEDPPEKPSFFAELKRRKVVRVALTYTIVAWLIVQVASATFSGFGIPEWAFRFVVIMLLLGFPVALIITWAFELTPDGVKLTKNVSEEQKAATSQSKRNWLVVVFAAALPTLIFGALAVYFYIARSDSPESVMVTDKSIAILPLANMSPDPENAFFADGVHEDILTNLSRINELFVISRTSTLGYKNTTKNLREIGAELGVRYLVEGSVRRAGNQVRVTVQLIDAETDEHIWAENYDRSLDNIFAIQSEIAKKIAGQLHAAISPEEIVEIDHRPTENQEAYDAYLKCKQLIEISPDTGLQKIALLEKAVSLDPLFAEAWALLSTESSFWWFYGEHRKDHVLLEKSKNALAEAERLAPNSATGLYAKAELLFREFRDVEGSIKTLLEALEVDPNNFFVQWGLASQYSAIGRLSESAHFLEAMERTDPYSTRVNEILLANRTYSESWDLANARINAIMEHTNGDARWQYWQAYVGFLQFDDLGVFQSELKRIPGFQESQKGRLWTSLMSKDYHAALQTLDGLSPMRRIGILGYFNNFDFVPVDLLSALILFETGEQESSRERAGSAKDVLEDIVSQSPLADPYYLSNLVIAYALEGATDRVELTIAKIRNLTAQANWQSEFQVVCEMHIAIAYLVLGDNDKAIETLEAAVQMDSYIFLHRELQIWFIFDRLRGNPRFDALLETDKD